MAGRFTGRVALVTGSGRGIGRATAIRLAAEGATVVVNDVNEAGIAETVATVEAAGGRAVPGPADITDSAAVDALVAAVVRDHGAVHILVNNAGGALPGARWTTVAETTDGDWDGFLALNLTAAFRCARAVLPSMLAAGRGHIVCVGSISGTNGQVNGAAYAAAKGGLSALVASIAKEYGAQGVSANAIVVGNAPFPNRPKERQDQLDSYVHLGRVGAYEEFAAAIAFLCGEDSSYLSGAMVPVDGGFHRSNLL
ncbi:SDR family NAD(P)-dependent oxidoreductase [Phytohabitans kaempferiae]|uniref:SDR family NAD(P)-dependent oxidoreductase n=1 Tax=Phytohabitans kaempferiae TaxID=1620943 RepID=A0ABV6LZH5_9ACTN